MARLEVPQLAQDAGWGRNNAVAEKMVAAGRHVVHGPSPAIRMGFRFRHLLQNETPAIVFFYLDKHLPLCNIHRALINRTSILLRTNQPRVRTGKRRKTTKKTESEKRESCRWRKALFSTLQLSVTQHYLISTAPRRRLLSRPQHPSHEPRRRIES